MASLFGASIFSPSPTPTCYQQYGNKVSFCPPQRMHFLKLSDTAPNSSWSLSYIVRAEVASATETIEIPITSETLDSAVEVPARRPHLVPLIGELTEGAHLPSAMEPWLDKLSIYDWDALVLDTGKNDWTISSQLVSLFKEKASMLDESVLFPPGTKKTQGDDVSEDDAVNEGDALPDSYVLDRESKNGSSGTQAEAGFLVTPKRSWPILKLYKSLAMVLANHKRSDELEQLQEQIKAEGIQPTPSFYNVLLSFYIAEKLTNKSLNTVSEMEKAGIQPTNFMFEKMAFMLMKEDPLDLSVPTDIMRNLMRKDLPVNIGIFKNLLKAYWRNKDADGVEEVFQAMQDAGHTPDQKTILKVMYCEKQNGNYERILELFEMMKNLGIKPDPNAYDQLIYAYSKAGLMEKAKELLSLYDSELGKKPTLVALNTLVHGYGKQGLYEDALQAFEDIRKNDYRPNSVSFATIIAAMVHAEQVTKAGQLYRSMLKLGLQPRLHTCITLIRAYTKLDWTQDGRKIVKEMRKSSSQMTPEAFGANLILYVEGHWYRHAAAVLRDMEKGSIMPDAAASAALVRSFCILGDYPTPLSKAVGQSDLEICKLLTSLFLNNPDHSRSETAFEEELLPFLEKWENVEDASALYNAFMECFWRRGSKTLARRLLSVAREIYAQSSKPQSSGTDRVLDIRGLSVGGAKAALIEWVISLVEAQGDSEIDDDTKMLIITGDEFQLDVIQDNRVLKKAMISMLGDLASPFKESSDDPKKLEAVAVHVMNWAVSDKIKELLNFGSHLSL